MMACQLTGKCKFVILRASDEDARRISTPNLRSPTVWTFATGILPAFFSAFTAAPHPAGAAILTRKDGHQAA